MALQNTEKEIKLELSWLRIHPKHPLSKRFIQNIFKYETLNNIHKLEFLFKFIFNKIDCF